MSSPGKPNERLPVYTYLMLYTGVCLIGQTPKNAIKTDPVTGMRSFENGDRDFLVLEEPLQLRLIEHGDNVGVPYLAAMPPWASVKNTSVVVDAMDCMVIHHEVPLHLVAAHLGFAGRNIADFAGDAQQPN